MARTLTPRLRRRAAGVTLLALFFGAFLSGVSVGSHDVASTTSAPVASPQTWPPLVASGHSEGGNVPRDVPHLFPGGGNAPPRSDQPSTVEGHGLPTAPRMRFAPARYTPVAVPGWGVRHCPIRSDGRAAIGATYLEARSGGTRPVDVPITAITCAYSPPQSGAQGGS